MLEAARDPHDALGAPRADTARRWLTRYAWLVLGYLLLVILFGAWVRVTGSGAGCGSHWPTCHGHVFPRNPDTEMLIEFTHRVTSGLLGVLVLGLVAFAFAVHQGPARRRVVLATLVTLAFTLVEAGIGAGIVLGELVANDASRARALVIMIHLGSTFSLTAATALAAFWSGREGSISFARAPAVKWFFVIAIAAVVLVSVTGAVTALGDTLFPVSPTESGGLLARLSSDLDPTSHFLVRLRILHPVLAVLVSGGLLVMPVYLSSKLNDTAARLTGAVRWLALLQVALGVANIALGAPGWLQLVHLLAAQGLWLSLIVAFAAALEANRALLPA